jgi:hypothetical protein
MQLPEAVDVRTTDKPEVLNKLKLQASKCARSTRLYASGTYFLRRIQRPFGRTNVSSEATFLAWGRGIDQPVFLEHATRLPGVWFRSLRCTFSDKTHLFLGDLLYLRMVTATMK